MAVFSVSNAFPVWPATSVLTLACMTGETPESWMGPMRTAGEVMVKSMAVIFCRPRPLVRAAFTVALMPCAASISENIWMMPSSMEPLAGKRP